MRVTVYDIEKHTKVSQPTVSSVLNNYPNIKDSTRKAVEKLNLIPNAVARKMQRSRII